jgi:hypothetical protein
MYKQLILLVGMVLGGPLPTTAQTPAPQIVQAPDRIPPTMMTAPEVSLAAPFLPPENPRKPVHFNYLFMGIYERDQHPEGLESLSPIREIRSLPLTQSSPRSRQYWGGRLRYDGTLHIQHVELGPLPTGGPQDFVPPRQTFPGGPFSVAPYGVSLSYRFGRNAHMGRATQIWRRLGRVVGATR